MMLPRSNVHTHTTFSDGANTVEETVQLALSRGFVSVGFSDHGACNYEVSGMRDEIGYQKEVRRIQNKYAGQIEVALGYEHDFLTPDADLSPYDYIIESVHCVRKDDIIFPIDQTMSKLKNSIDQLYGGDPYAVIRDYFATVNQSMLDFKADIVGHIGAITKFNEKTPLFDSADPRYMICAKETVALAAEKDMLVEINTGAMSRGLRTTPYPDPVLLRLLKELGGRITITSDCHRAEWLDFGFDKAIEIAKAAGFTEAWIWENGGFVPKALD